MSSLWKGVTYTSRLSIKATNSAIIDVTVDHAARDNTARLKVMVDTISHWIGNSLLVLGLMMTIKRTVTLQRPTTSLESQAIESDFLRASCLVVIQMTI